MDDDFLNRQPPEIRDLLLSEGFFPEQLVRRRARANGEGTIRQRGRTYEGRITLGMGADGKQIRQSVYGKTRKECFDKMIEAKQAYKEKGLPDYREVPILSDWIETWITEYKRDKAVSTLNRYRNIIAKIHTSAIAGKKLSDILPIELQQFVNTISSHEMAKKTIGMLRDVFTTAADNGLITKNPAASLRNTIATPKPKFDDTDKAFTPEEEQRFMDAVRNNPYRLLYCLCLYGGLRRAEACAMTWESIDLNKRVMHVKEAATRSDKNGYEIGKTKTAKSVRTVPLSGKLYEILSAAPSRDSKYIFERNGKMLNPDILTTDFRNIMQSLGLNHTLHQLRHTFATQCFEKGINVKVVQAWMGHEKADMTLNTYTHASAQMFADAVEKLW